MHLFRTICTHDWKGRPDHRLKLIAISDDKYWLKEQMDRDIIEWMVNDIVNDEQNDEDAEPKDWDARRTELLADAMLKTLWSCQNEDGDSRFEMNLEGKDHREFVEKFGDGSVTTTVYHFVEGHDGRY